jgi:NADPH-dependent 2,4-dienoyl-CoA reductase/sulfur reductase-like enzyme
MLRREGYDGALHLIDAGDTYPVDRPNLSKDYLAGHAQEEWVNLRPTEYYQQQNINLLLNTRVVRIDVPGRAVETADGRRLAFDRLLLATGASPVRLQLPGSDLPHVHYLRTLADSRSIIAATAHAKQAVVIGASFIGLEVAAALRARNINVYVVAPEERPLQRVLGIELGDMVRSLHESRGVVFHLRKGVAAIETTQVRLDGGEILAADLVVVGVGVRPDIALAEQAGIAVENGVLVDEYLQSSVPDIFAAGDIARWPDRRTGQQIRVEHWVVAERQGQVAARNMLGQRMAYTAIPFFWSRHYDLSIDYVGHAERWDRVTVDGDPQAHDCAVTYYDGSRQLAVATVSREMASLNAEVQLQRF